VCFFLSPRYEDVIELFSSSALDRGEWSASRTDRFTPWERTHSLKSIICLVNSFQFDEWAYLNKGRKEIQGRAIDDDAV
jgi:hypothetical protein